MASESADDPDDAEQVYGLRIVAVEAGDAGGRIDRLLAERLPEFSRARLQALIAERRVSVDGAVVTSSSANAVAGDYRVEVPAPVAAEPQGEDIPLVVLFEDAHLIVVDKPPGMAVHPAPGSESGTLVNALLHHCGDSLSGIGGVMRPGIVHRIDKDTSGVVVFARTAEAHRMLNVAFEQRQVTKGYLAFVAGGLDGVTRIDVPLHEARKGKARPAVPGEPGAKHAVTELVVVRRWPRDGAIVAKVDCRPITGRHHQLRVHLRWAGAPILHDPLYGKDTLRGPLAAAPCRRLALHAAELTVPGGRRFVAPLPDDLVALERWLDA